MINPIISVSRSILLALGRIIIKLVLEITLDGQDYLPTTAEPLILISNHFSWFDAPLLTLLLPFQPAFLVATESQRKWWVRAFILLFNGIPIWRGQVDRTAFRKALTALDKGQIVGVFPEGGINPALATSIARGQTIPELHGNTARMDAKLVHPRAGVALLAVMSRARILPVGLIGTERILNNLRHWRRTPVTVRIGPIFGPFQLDPQLGGRARRQQLDQLAEAMMQQIARLFPPENRGCYQWMDVETPSI